MSLFALPRPTPWVWRLILANGVVLLLLTALVPSLAPALAFVPDAGQALRHPWTWVSYAFVHAGLLHLAFNMLVLYALGCRVEERMGNKAFILFYLYCAVGGALFSLGLVALQPGSVVGASAAVLGVAVAYAMYWPEEELTVFPFPWPVQARTLVIALLVLDVVFALTTPRDGIAHVSHLGGAAFAYLYFRIQRLQGGTGVAPGSTAEPAELVTSGRGESGQADTPVPLRRRARGAPSAPKSEHDEIAAETDRLLDKIGRTGLASLTPAERRFLDEVSRKKRH